MIQQHQLDSPPRHKIDQRRCHKCNDQKGQQIVFQRLHVFHRAHDSRHKKDAHIFDEKAACFFNLIGLDGLLIQLGHQDDQTDDAVWDGKGHDGCHYDPNETNAENQRKFHNDVHEKVPLDFLFSLKNMR